MTLAQRIKLITFIVVVALLITVTCVSATWVYAETPLEPETTLIEIQVFPWEGSEILPDDVVGENHKVLINNILNGVMTDSNGKTVEIGINNPDSEISNQIEDRISKRKYTFGSMDYYDSDEMNAIFGLDAADLTFMMYSPQNNTSVKYLYTTSCDLGEAGLLWWGNAKYPTGERIYPIYRTRLEYVEQHDEKGKSYYEWVAVKTVLGSAESSYYDNDTFGSAVSKNPAFNPTTFAPVNTEDCESGETAIAMGKTINNAIYIPLGAVVNEVVYSTDVTYFKYTASTSGTIKITPGVKREYLSIKVYSDSALSNLVASAVGKELSFNASARTYYIVATGDMDLSFTIK